MWRYLQFFLGNRLSRIFCEMCGKKDIELSIINSDDENICCDCENKEKYND